MPSAESTVLYRVLPTKFKISSADKRALRGFARNLAAQVAPGRSFICLIANDRTLADLNRNFLGNDYPTDVLSFPSGQPGAELGELAISIDRAAAQSEEFGHSLLDELRILMLHGLLHLTGLDHERDRGAMARAERKWQEAFNLPAALITRSQSTTSTTKAAV
ncbi:MAG TPA: rRNA maturation RNase YbeY [Bryobacteraceae bacterium]|jgi:probable rRNA maturation factor|nr:rRNA maturation RNase YbeY [Bryobacteraceae bacterium]